MKQFTRVTKDNPCPICNKADWCEFGDRAVHCMRVESENPAKDGGFYHFYDKTAYRPATARKQAVNTPLINAFGMWRTWFTQTDEARLAECAEDLNVLPQAIIAIGGVWAAEFRAWAFPMYNEKGQMIGIRLRNREGFKWTVRGSRNGVFLPGAVVKPPEMAFIPEGPTDCAALLSLGFYPIGRPNDQSCFENIKQQCARLNISKVVIVSDNDELKRYANTEVRPGLRAAMKLKAQLGFPSVIWMPPSPIKDVRQFVREGGTQEMIMNDLATKIFLRK